MERLNKPARPRLLSDIQEIESEVSKSPYDGPPGNPLSSTEQQHSAANSPQPLIQAGNDHQESTLPSLNILPSSLPKKPPPAAASGFIANGLRPPKYPSYKAPRQFQQSSKPAMDSPSASAPASLRAERSDYSSSSPSSGEYYDASLVRASSASDILLISPSPAERNTAVSQTSSASDVNITSPPNFEHSRELYTSDHQRSVQTGKMNRKHLSYLGLPSVGQN